MSNIITSESSNYAFWYSLRASSTYAEMRGGLQRKRQAGSAAGVKGSEDTGESTLKEVKVGEMCEKDVANTAAAIGEP